MFNKDNQFKAFESKVWLSSPTMHGDELKYMTQAYETNWMSTVGENINQVEAMTCEKIGCKYAVGLSCGTASLHLSMKLAEPARKSMRSIRKKSKNSYQRRNSFLKN